MPELRVDQWAERTFGRARLGDPRRNRRLVSMAAAVARHPGGTVTATQGTKAAREGAFRFLESEHIDSESVAEAVFEAAADECAQHPYVFVIVDQTDLSYVDRRGVRGLGPIQRRDNDSMGAINFMNALALDPRGIPLGLVDQQWWLRPKERTPWGKKDPRPPEERESWYWVRAIDAVENRLSWLAPNTTPWFVMDRAADFHGVLVKAVERGQLVTIRSCYNRRIRRNGVTRWLWKTLARRPVLGYLDVRVPASTSRAARVARLELRALRAKVRLSHHPNPEIWGELSCVRVREVGTVPSGEPPIEWKLLSTHPVRSFEDAKEILNSYTLRWRIEELHKTWKSGACNVERSQLRSLDAIRRWATILAAVATRVERLKLLSREQPDLDALEEFTRDELDAAIILSETKRYAVGCQMTLDQAVRLVAMIGGYMDRKRDGPPGSITIRRGLDLVLSSAIAVRALRSSG